MDELKVKTESNLTVAEKLICLHQLGNKVQENKL